MSGVDEAAVLADAIEARAAAIYPADIFRPPTSEDYAAINALLLEHRGHQLDGIAADCYRRAHAGIAAAIRRGDIEDYLTATPTDHQSQPAGGGSEET